MITEKEIRDLTNLCLQQGWKTDEYIEKLLPKEIKYLKQERKILVQHSEILVQLVGFSWEPLLISLCAYKPKKIFLILNQDYNDKGGIEKGQDFIEYINALKKQGLIDNDTGVFPNPLKTVNGDKNGSVFDFLKSFILPFINGGKRVVIDITGGKKSMVSEAYLFSSYTNCPVSYLDFDYYDEKYRKPYGYKCKIGELDNPMKLFKLREWSRVEQLYDQYSFQEAKNLINVIKEDTKSLLDENENKAIDILTECLEFYGTWDDGDYREAWEKYRKLNNHDIICPTAVEKLNSIWPDKNNLKEGIKQLEGTLNLFSWDKIPGDDNGRLIEFLKQKFSINWIKPENIKKNDDGTTIRATNKTNFLSLTLNDKKTNVNLEIDDGRMYKFIAKTENDKLTIYNYPIYLKEADLLVYANDELEKIKRLLKYNGDYRSGLLRAAGLNDFLFRARIIQLWFKNQLIVKINNNEETRETITNNYSEYLSEIDGELLKSSATYLYKVLNDNKKSIKIHIKDFNSPITAHRSNSAQFLDKFWESLKKPKKFSLPNDIFELRNKAIHFCISVQKEIAEVAVNFAEENLKDFQKKWTENEINNGTFSALIWYELCDACEIKFLPKLNGGKNE